jgi:GNAT superfamily N-acetyltransferase
METHKPQSPVAAPAIRTAEIADAEAIARLVNAAFLPERYYVDGDRTDPERVRALQQTGKFLLVGEPDSLAGCVYVEPRGERGYLGLLSVAPGQQRSGLGSRLIAAAEDHCRSAGCGIMDLTFVNLRTVLPPFYRRLGYTENGAEPFPVPSKVPCHLVKMTKPLA